MSEAIKRFPGNVPTRSQRGGPQRARLHGGHRAEQIGLRSTSRRARRSPPSTATWPKRAPTNRASSRATVFITDMGRKPEMNRAWDEWVDKANPPRRACIGAALEDKDLVEILVTAAQ